MDSKRQRVDKALLSKVVHTRGVSGSALRRVVNTLTGAGLTRHEVEMANYARFNQVKHTLRFPSVDGGEVSFDVCDPKALLALLLSENPVMRQWFEEAWRTSPSTPSAAWNLVIGWDEFTPGNKAALKSSRKMMTFVLFIRGAPSLVAPRPRMGDTARDTVHCYGAGARRLVGDIASLSEVDVDRRRGHADSRVSCPCWQLIAPALRQGTHPA